MTKTPARMFVRAPWSEIWAASGLPKGTGCSELVNAWNRSRANPKGLKVKRWRYDNKADVVVMELVKIEKWGRV